MSEHTPGPWKVDSKYCVGPVSQEDDQSYGMIIPVADVYGPNIQADAELIASAPQLREQNRVLVRYLEQARDSAKQVHNMAMKNVRPNPDTITMENVAINHLEFVDRLLRAALTATSQEGQG